MRYTNEELVECLQREVQLRKRVYPNRVHTHRMSPKEATKQIAMMEQLLAEYQTKSRAEQLPL